jgi:uncharacterized membrane protein YidH (DUF202 family)
MKRGLGILVFGTIIAAWGANQVVYYGGQPLVGVYSEVNFQQNLASKGAIWLVVGIFVMILGIMTWYHYHGRK